MNRDLAWSFMAACGLHVVALLGLGLGLMRPAEFGTQVGRNSIEVNLIAAPPEASAASLPQPAPQPVTPPAPEPPREDDFIVPAVTEPPRPVPPVEKPPTSNPEHSAISTQHSAPQPSTVHSAEASVHSGKDSATIQSEGGARNEAKPGYLKNPPPRYPEKARRLGQEGVVMLSVKVNAEGEPESVEIKQGSGFPLLDEAAVKAVQHWVFRPASVGSVPVPSQVDIPVRFDLH